MKKSKLMSIIVLIVLFFVGISFLYSKYSTDVEQNVDLYSQNVLDKKIDSEVNVLEKDTDDIENDKKVYLSIEEGTLTNTSATLVIKDLTKKDRGYGYEYEIEKKEYGEWIKLWRPVYKPIPEISLIPGDDGILYILMNWEEEYGKLPPGKYRIVKDFSEAQNAYAEFELIDDNSNNDISDKAKVNGKNIYMSIKDGTITDKGIVITISNVGNTDQLYDQNYMIDKKENGKWVRLEKNRNNEEFQNDLIAGAKKMNGLSINWEEEYGELSAGKYRITKEFSIDKEVYVEFEIK